MSEANETTNNMSEAEGGPAPTGDSATTWGPKLFLVTTVGILLFFWWLLIYSGGVVLHH